MREKGLQAENITTTIKKKKKNYLHKQHNTHHFSVISIASYF